MERLFLLVGSLFGFAGVAAGAFGAHALRGVLSARDLEIFETAVRYQLVHAVVLLGVGLWLMQRPSSVLVMAGWSHIAGVVVFSGSLYVLVLTQTRWLGAVTPLGGVALLAGWLCLAWAALQTQASNLG